jgi:AraC-like DNA-binding protein
MSDRPDAEPPPAGPPSPAGPLRLPILGTASAYVMVRVAGEYGLSQDHVLRGTGIEPDVLENARATIRVEQEVALARNLLRELAGVPRLGLLVSDRYRLSLYGILGWGMLCSATAGEALAFAGSYRDLTYALCGLCSRGAGDELHILVEGRGLPEDVRGFFVERTVGSVVRLLGDLMDGDAWLLGVEMTRERPAEARLFAEALGTAVRFGRPADRVRVDRRALHRPMPLANEQMLRLIEQECRQEVARRRAGLMLRDSVREYVLNRLPDLPGMAEVAAALGTSERTLRRRLTEEGTSFSSVVLVSRRTLAEDLLLRGVPPVQVSRRIGFAGPAAFTHAFKRWTGVSPREFALR